MDIKADEIGAMVRRWTCLILLLLALNAFSHNLGYISSAFSRMLGILSLIGVAALYITDYKNITNKRELASGSVLILISILLLSFPRNEYWIVSLPIFISGFDLVLRSARVREEGLSAMSLGSIIYAAFYICYINIPALWLGLKYSSQSLSGILGGAMGVPLSLGPTVSGTLIFLTFLFCSIASLASSRLRVPLKIWIISIAGLILAYAGFVMAHALSWMAGDMAVDYLYVAFLIFTIPFIMIVQRTVARSDPVTEIESAPISGKKGLAALILILFSFASVAIFPYTGDVSSGKIVIYERGCEMGFGLPGFPEENEPFKPYDGYSVGAFGLYLKKIGYEVEELNDTNPKTLVEALKDADVLMMINLNESLPADDLEHIWKFMGDGGSLIAFGDHTSMFVSDEDFKLGKDYLNEVLLPTGIRINPDTADFIGAHWIYANTYLPHHITKDLRGEITTTSVGASLNLSGSARPVIIGRYAFSDDPDPDFPGHLGNRTYEKGEELGDIVLVASDTYGRGNVLVFGDTSYIFNSEMPVRYRLAQDSVEWLMSHKSAPLSALPWAALAALGILAIGSLFYMRPRKGLVSYQASIAIAMALSLVIAGSINESLIQSQEREMRDIAWIDHSHLNQLNLNNFEADSIDGLTINLIRNGYMPLVLDERARFSDVMKGDLLVIMAPNDLYTTDEISIINSLVRSGGLLIISSGHGSAGPLDPLLRSFNLSIGSTPLGSPPWITETHGTGDASTVTPENLERYWHKPKFMEAYPVMAIGECEPMTWLNYGGIGYNLTIAKRFGNGSVVLIGDSRFLLNENLEYASDLPGKEGWEQYQLQWLGNIELLREIISKYGGARL